MFGLFKKKKAPEGPITLSFAVDVERPAEEVYPLIDWADPRNAKRQLGETVTAIEGSPNFFRLVMSGMPEHNFDMLVSEAVPNRSYRFSTDINPRVGRLEASEEYYELEPSGDGQCQLSLTITAKFRAGLTERQFKEEALMIGVACHNALLRLKAHAEEGVEGERALEKQLYG